MAFYHWGVAMITNAFVTVGTWFAFKKFLRRKAEKMERTNLTYGAMARLCRDGGFWVRTTTRFHTNQLMSQLD